MSVPASATQDAGEPIMPMPYDSKEGRVIQSNASVTVDAPDDALEIAMEAQRQAKTAEFLANIVTKAPRKPRNAKSFRLAGAE
jgi:hypothetical protein